MRHNTDYEVNFLNNTITITKKFAKAASVLGSSEYNTLMMLKKDNPDFTIELREIKKKEGKKTYRHLTFEVMEDIIIRIDGKDSKNLAAFETVKVQAKLQPSPYAYAKKWFLANYKDAMDAPFSIEEEKKNDKPTFKLIEA